MSNSMKGMVAGLVATLVLSGLLLLKSTMDLMPELNIIRLLTVVGGITTVQAWMYHFIVGVVVWGLAFGAYDSLSAEQLESASSPIKVSIAGRIMAIRVQGKAGFAQLQQGGQRFQIYVRKDDVGGLQDDRNVSG